MCARVCFSHHSSEVNVGECHLCSMYSSACVSACVFGVLSLTQFFSHTMHEEEAIGMCVDILSSFSKMSA